ncbi:MAG: hypothetical protein JJ992_30170, partial [Planctomycetes bacterium]|nr:hypothetical protein [Planctomycetota bacterium]
MVFLKLAWFLGMSLVAAVLALSLAYLGPPRLGLDLAGGVRLIYAVDREVSAEQDTDASIPEMIDWVSLERALRNRIDPSRVHNGEVRRLPPWHIEIMAPVRTDPEIDRIKRLVSTAGVLEFRVVANPVDHQSIIELARQQAADAESRRSMYVHDGDKMVGYWARVGRESVPILEGIHPLKVQVAGDVLRDANTGQLIDFPFGQDPLSELALERYLSQRGIGDVQVLMATDDGFDLTGANL